MFTALGIAGGAAVVAGAGAAGASAVLYRKEQARKKRLKTLGEQERNWAIQYRAAGLEAIRERLDVYDKRQSRDSASSSSLQVASILYELGRRLEEEDDSMFTPERPATQGEATDGWTTMEFSALRANSESFAGAGKPSVPPVHEFSAELFTSERIDAEMASLAFLGDLETEASSGRNDDRCEPLYVGASGVPDEVEKRLRERAEDESFPPMTRAIAMYERAVALASHSLAARRLGVMHLEGKTRGLERHHGKAWRLLKMAAKKGDIEALFRLGMLCLAHCRVESGLKYLKKCSKMKSEFQKTAQDAIACTDSALKDHCTCLADGTCILDSHPVMDFLVESEPHSLQRSVGLGRSFSSDSFGRKQSRSLARLMRRKSSLSSTPRQPLHGSSSQPSLSMHQQNE